MRGDAKPPPADLAGRDLGLHVVFVDTSGWRISHEEAPLVDWSASAEARFSHPDLPFKVLYLGMSKETCFWERFGEEIRDQAPGARAISRKLLAERVWKTWKIDGDDALRCLDLTDMTTLRAMGADAATFLSSYGITQAWSKALMEHPAGIDGLVYASRLNAPDRCHAIFARPPLAANPTLFALAVSAVRPIDDPELLALLLRENIGLPRATP
jgi:hypothetical protein